MVMTTVLADCPECRSEVEAKIVDCDECFDKYRDRGGDEDTYDALQNCTHLRCLACSANLSE